MKIELSGLRTEVTLEGNVVEIMLDLAELQAPTRYGRKLLRVFRDENEHNLAVSKTDYPIESGIEVGYVLRPLMYDFILVILLHDNGEYTVDCHKDMNSKSYIHLYNFLNGKRG